MGIGIDERDDVQRLLARIKDALVPLQSLLDRCSGEQGFEDPMYRFYHQSWHISMLGSSWKWLCDMAASCPIHRVCCQPDGRRSFRFTIYAETARLRFDVVETLTRFRV
jgi:hypothetical protein